VRYGNIQGYSQQGKPKAKKKNIAISLVEQERFLSDKGNPAQACSTLSSIGVVFMVLKKKNQKMCM